MTEPLRRADCTRCVALCCVAFAFDRSASFAFDKKAEIPCSFLSETHHCRIHFRLEQSGFSGCSSYDCDGAGQRVSEELFGGRSWRENPELARAMFDAFRRMRLVHELLVLLRAARGLPLSREHARQREAYEATLCPPQGWTTDTLASFEEGPLPLEIRTFFLDLRGDLSPLPSRRRLPVLNLRAS